MRHPCCPSTLCSESDSRRICFASELDWCWYFLHYSYLLISGQVMYQLVCYVVWLQLHSNHRTKKSLRSVLRMGNSNFFHNRSSHGCNQVKPIFGFADTAEHHVHHGCGYVQCLQYVGAPTQPMCQCLVGKLRMPVRQARSNERRHCVAAVTVSISSVFCFPWSSIKIEWSCSHY